ncbi:hypothetical protein ACJDU8_15810 [Clostridium sp. WILCCON 0269]|uniref:Uncharacterized protein n=1 Tax=Candidatus Clostridium eludens TaxID=3381663 RepID=A0ABW8SMX6_9CLOT
MNKIYIELNNNGEIGMIQYMPFDPIDGLHKTEEELLQTGYLVDEIPAPDPVAGKAANLKYNKGTNSLYYEYVDIPPQPPTTDQRVTQLESDSAKLAYAVMMLGGDI